MASTEPSAVESKKSQKTEPEPSTAEEVVGDWKLFLSILGTSLLKLLVVVILGSGFLALADIRKNGGQEKFDEVLEKIFPTDKNEAPYCVNGKASCKSKLTAPLSFPYQQLSDRIDEPRRKGEPPSWNWQWVWAWFEMTFMDSFIDVRKGLQWFYNKTALLDQNDFGSLVLFYLLPVLFIYSFPFIGFLLPILLFLVAWTKSHLAVKEGYMWTYFFVTYLFEGLGYAGLSAFKADPANIGSGLLTAFLGLVAGLPIMFVNFTYFGLIAYLATFYILIVALPMVMYTVGAGKMFETVKDHGRSLCAIITLIIMYSSYHSLNQNVSTGALILGFILLYGVFKNKTMFEMPTKNIFKVAVEDS